MSETTRKTPMGPASRKALKVPSELIALLKLRGLTPQAVPGLPHACKFKLSDEVYSQALGDNHRSWWRKSKCFALSSMMVRHLLSITKQDLPLALALATTQAELTDTNLAKKIFLAARLETGC